MKVRDLKALLETMPGEADVVWQNDDSTEDVIRCESGMYSIVDSVEKMYLFTRTGLTASVLPGWDNLSSRCTP
ncbi:hypothetical protein KAM472_40370 [Aeromonas caviae]|nr:hypothetical protein KAM462_39890 [Aeromonas caviae]GKR12574.1 hypothetical protein KAM465_41510 [Aeromonas caviae]GKR16840.1 hypothetical protein KAM466_41580 [Aeromonas caviae]GKR42341.1 hypothetical protein KAM472_40370 [Aeromonas caviae]GKR50744.1 hypothetical protein KAM474_41620 [Aeromonas caviae]